MRWFDEARFGMFVHFGAYSGAARHEWVQSFERIGAAEYQQYVDHFDPDRFDARDIARTARTAGMGYVVLTTKHHEGFALFDSQLSDFCAPRVCGRDLVREFVDACRAEGLRVGFYYSLLDWHHPDFTVDWHHPLRDDPAGTALNEGRDMARYRAFLHGQVRELLTNYGRIDYFFFDFTYPQTVDGWAGKGPEDWDSAGLLALCRGLQPEMLINDRLGIGGDLVTPEQYQPTAPLRGPDGGPQVWEACQTMNGSWGYHRDNLEYKSADLLARMLVDSVSMGGNMLLNIGPDGRGAITPRDRATLAEIGAWLELHQDAVIGAGYAGMTPPAGGVYTRRGDRLHLHLFTWPMGFVHCPDLAGRVRYARLLNDGSHLKTSVIAGGGGGAGGGGVDGAGGGAGGHMTPSGLAPGTLTVHIPVRRPDVLIPVIEFTLAE